MESVLLYNDAGVDIANGRYAVFGGGGKLVAQDDDFDVAVKSARTQGVECPAVVDLEINKGKLHVL